MGFVSFGESVRDKVQLKMIVFFGLQDDARVAQHFKPTTALQHDFHTFSPSNF